MNEPHNSPENGNLSNNDAHAAQFWEDSMHTANSSSIQSDDASEVTSAISKNQNNHVYFNNQPTEEEEEEFETQSYAADVGIQSPRRNHDDLIGDSTYFTADNIITNAEELFREMDRISQLDPKDLPQDEEEEIQQNISTNTDQSDISHNVHVMPPMNPSHSTPGNSENSGNQDNIPIRVFSEEEQPKTESDLYEFILDRMSNLVNVSKTLFPDIDDEYLLIKNLAAKGSRAFEMSILDEKIKQYKLSNATFKEELSNQPKLNMESVKLKREIQNAKKIIERLKKAPPPQIPTTNSMTIPNHPEIGHPISMQAHIMKEKRSVEELQKQVTDLQENLDKLNKRIALMSQTKSSYVYDPSLLSPTKPPPKLKLPRKKVKVKKAKTIDAADNASETQSKKRKKKKSKRSKTVDPTIQHESNTEASDAIKSEASSMKSHKKRKVVKKVQKTK
ncbi:hypothetical protein TVAG_312480 [Trichomonas vaginalis G3]|uniref:Uncharacterized protein n=1 Tax=Trichomonas vaginalis (strain ATCC PRA-98 / G3) TaxID=412133 RepID=A2EHQ3_TRIV3|nr:hypothetical protein TVAGG3_0242750 [Trichomonas vaginalis G3]EAY07849.1 hypothetical protein TVAG_312480 [Trichomonas vaginalis G3]KAI5553461.1 hypothetical protein TVAGG3_0242750 [Trichomonas vaginalis G3]|eukprot:XP_001320072.1 hypothetical protein [Trichomonas vaginalis G3]